MQAAGPTDSPFARIRQLERMRTWLMRLLLLTMAGTGWAHTSRADLPAPAQLERALLREPAQRPTQRAPFEFEYRGGHYRVRPVFEYELSGLVVTRNHIDGLGDLYHDGDSVDTVDICVVWGSNLARGAYQEVEFSSGSFTCYWRFWGNVDFRSDEIANNHLITADEQVRARIGEVEIGDQVRLRGALVDYQDSRWGGFWRRSSTDRIDTGGGACEVVLVDEFEILRAENHTALALRSAGLGLCTLLALCWLALFAYASRLEAVR